MAAVANSGEAFTAPSTWDLHIDRKRTGGAMLGDAPDYAAMATPVTLVQVAKARVRPDRIFAAVSWSRRRGKKIGDLVMDGKKALNLPR